MVQPACHIGTGGGHTDGIATLDELRHALIELDETKTLRLTKQLLAQEGPTRPSILSTCQQALKVVGERYERQEYYISGLIMAGELFKEVLDMVQPPTEEEPRAEPVGTVVLGTVAKDIHDIGKRLFGTALRGFGFRVVDLGVDVPPESFLKEVLHTRPDVLCLSGLIMAAFESMKETVSLVRAHERELGYYLPVAIGGAIIDGRVCEFVGADSWSTDAMEGVRLCQGLLKPAEGKSSRSPGGPPRS
jgi:methanogenic corrinoid protein MtbC1